MNLTAFAIRNNTTVIVLTAIMAVYGIYTYFQLPKQQDPGFTIRAAVVITQFPGASPERVEQLVTDKIEKAIQEIPELDNVTSESTQGVSFVTANFQEKFKDMRPIFDKLRRKISDITDLPEGVRTPVVNDEYGDVFGIVYTLTGDGFTYRELNSIADEVRDEILKVEDVAKVQIQGKLNEVVFVEYNNSRLKEIGLSPLGLASILQSLNILQSGGDILTGPERITLEPSGNFESVEQIQNTVIQIPGSDSVVYLKDIANVFRDYKDPPDGLSRTDSKPTVVLAVSMSEGGNILELGKRIDSRVPQIESVYPLGIELKKIYFQPDQVQNSVSSFMVNLGQAVAIVLAVMLLFLGLRTGLIVSMLVPTTIILTFVLMQTFGITVNQISLAALIIALGLLVDNAIVMAESIMVRRQNGEDAVSAAIAAGGELATPLLVSSLTTAAAFLCIFLAESAVGEYTADIFKVVTIALLASWLLAMTVIPLLTISLMKIAKVKNDVDPFETRMYRIYRTILLWCVRNKLIFMLLVAGCFYLGIQGLNLVPKVFIPPRTDPVISAEFNLPFGTAIETTEKMVQDIEQFWQQNLKVHPDQIAQQTDSPAAGIISWVAFIGQAAPRYELAVDPGSDKPHASKFIIHTTDGDIIPQVIKDTSSFLQALYPDVEIIMKKLENGTPIAYPIQVRVFGKEIDELYKIINSLKTQLRQTPGVLFVNDDWGIQTKKLLVKVNQNRALRAGVTNQDVATSLQSSLSGIELTQYRENNDLIPITMRTNSAERQDIGKLDNISVFSSSGDAVPLKQVADITLGWQNAIIKRRDRDKAITVQALLSPGFTATEVGATFFPWLAEQSTSWRNGYDYELGGESETSGDANEAIAAKLPISGMLIVLLLVAQFNSIRKPLIILSTIPLGLIGITIGLLLARSVFGFFTILGLISLSGIIINNAIVLIDRIKIESEENGLAINQAIIEACQQRLRPILLTTATTVGGMLPLWISHDPMFETMAVSIIFGLMFATLLTLAVVPVLYSIFFRVDFKTFKY